MFLACRSDRLLDQRNGLFLCIVTHSYYKAYNNFFPTRISHTLSTKQLPKLECGCTLRIEFLVRNPCLCTRLVDFTTVLFFRGVDQALFSQSCSFRPDNGLNIFCCELTSTVQTLGALITMESFNDDVYSIRARTRCVPLKIPCMHLFPFLSNSNTFI